MVVPVSALFIALAAMAAGMIAGWALFAVTFLAMTRRSRGQR